MVFHKNIFAKKEGRKFGSSSFTLEVGDRKERKTIKCCITTEWKSLRWTSLVKFLILLEGNAIFYIKYSIRLQVRVTRSDQKLCWCIVPFQAIFSSATNIIFIEYFLLSPYFDRFWLIRIKIIRVTRNPMISQEDFRLDTESS